MLLIIIICLIIATSVSVTTEPIIVEINGNSITYSDGTTVEAANVDKIACKDGYQYYVEYPDGTVEEYFECNLEAINELMREYGYD